MSWRAAENVTGTPGTRPFTSSLWYRIYTRLQAALDNFNVVSDKPRRSGFETSRPILLRPDFCPTALPTLQHCRYVSRYHNNYYYL